MVDFSFYLIKRQPEWKILKKFIIQKMEIALEKHNIWIQFKINKCEDAIRLMLNEIV